VELLFGTPISSVLKDSEEPQRCSMDDDIEEDEELQLIVVTEGELFSKTVEVLVSFEVVT
jgi:hypothetical protein